MIFMLVLVSWGDSGTQNFSSARAVMGSPIDVKAARLGWGWLLMYLLSLLIAAFLPITLEFVTPFQIGYYDLWMVDGDDRFKLAERGCATHV
jgi:hypothetical protein